MKATFNNPIEGAERSEEPAAAGARQTTLNEPANAERSVRANLRTKAQISLKIPATHVQLPPLWVYVCCCVGLLLGVLTAVWSAIESSAAQANGSDSACDRARARIADGAPLLENIQVEVPSQWHPRDSVPLGTLQCCTADGIESCADDAAWIGANAHLVEKNDTTGRVTEVLCNLTCSDFALSARRLMNYSTSVDQQTRDGIRLFACKLHSKH